MCIDMCIGMCAVSSPGMRRTQFETPVALDGSKRVLGSPHAHAARHTAGDADNPVRTFFKGKDENDMPD